MQSLYSFIVVAIVVLGLTGCGDDTRLKKQGEGTDSAVSLVGDKTFPSELVGTWKATGGDRWAFTFAEDGTLVSLVNDFNGLIIVSDGGAWFEDDQGLTILFVLGACEVDYDALTRKLDVSVRTDDLTLEAPDGTSITGRRHDIFSGVVSVDGTEWTADWWDRGQMDGWPPQDPNVPPHHLLFKKVSSELPEMP